MSRLATPPNLWRRGLDMTRDEVLNILTTELDRRAAEAAAQMDVVNRFVFESLWQLQKDGLQIGSLPPPAATPPAGVAGQPPESI